MISRQCSCFGNKIRSQIFNGYIRIYEVFRVGGLLSDIKGGYQIRVAGDIKVSVFIAVIDFTIAAVNLGAFRDKEADDPFSFNDTILGRQIKGRIQLLRIIQGGYKLVFDLFHRFGGNTGYLSTVIDAKY